MLQWKELSFLLMGSLSQVALGVAGGVATALCLFGAPAFALQTFTFSNAKFWDNLASPSDNLDFNGTITGSFDWDGLGGGGGNFSNVNVTFTVFDGNPAPTSINDVPQGSPVAPTPITFTNGQMFTINNLTTLVFDNGGNGNNSIGAVVDLSAPLGTFPNLEPSDPDPGTFTSYFCLGNFEGGSQGVAPYTCPSGQTVEFNEVSGQLVPGPLSGVALSPLALLYRLRKRYRYMGSTAEATPVSVEGAELQ